MCKLANGVLGLGVEKPPGCFRGCGQCDFVAWDWRGLNGELFGAGSGVASTWHPYVANPSPYYLSLGKTSIRPPLKGDNFGSPKPRVLANYVRCDPVAKDIRNWLFPLISGLQYFYNNHSEVINVSFNSWYFDQMEQLHDIRFIRFAWKIYLYQRA